MNSLWCHLKSWSSCFHPSSNSLQPLYRTQLTYYPFRNALPENYSEPVFSITKVIPPPFPIHISFIVSHISLQTWSNYMSIVVIVFMFWKLLVCILESTIYIGKCIREPNKEESFLMSLQYSRKGTNKTTNYTYAFNESYKWRSTFHSLTFNMKVYWLQFWKQKFSLIVL